MHEEQRPLPVRGPIHNQAIASARGLWQDDRCTDIPLLERVAAGIRALDTATEYSYDREVFDDGGLQREIDGVIARWRRAHAEPRHDR